jgi:dephospho-CoA kinase
MIFGLTGSIACGKSSVAKIFSNAGVPMVGADEVARSLADQLQNLSHQGVRDEERTDTHNLAVCLDTS